MTYRAYIKKDYKPVIRWIPDEPWYRRKIGPLAILFAGLALCLSYLLIPNSEPVASTTLFSQPILPTARVPLLDEDIHTYLEEADVDVQAEIAAKEKDAEKDDEKKEDKKEEEKKDEAESAAGLGALFG